MRRLLFVLLMLVLLVPAVLAQEDESGDITLEDYTDETFNLQGLRPVGWQNAGPGTYLRGSTPENFGVYLAQSIPGDTAQFKDLLTNQLGLESFPEADETLVTDAFTWELYMFEVDAPNFGPVNVDVGLAADEGQAYLVLVQAPPADYENLHDNVFLPAVEALAPLGLQTLPDVDQSTFTEEEVEFGLEDWRLPGTLSVPVGDGPFPAVVLVHGSGPNDRDETLGNNKMFRDLAWGLAEQGFVVLRYDKRTLVHGQRIVETPDFTVDDETVTDALEAVDFLREQASVNADAVFVIGHSLGATMIPRIAERGENLPGVVMLAGYARPFGDVLQDQVDYLREFYDTTDETFDEQSTLAQLDQLEALAENLNAVQDGQEISEVFSEEAQVSYWGSIVDYDQVATAQELNLPMLILQGERDYQVTMEDFSLWQEALGDNVTFMSYPDLNHIFMPLGDLDTLSNPLDLAERSFMAEDVIDDIAEWMSEQV